MRRIAALRPVLVALALLLGPAAFPSRSPAAEEEPDPAAREWHQWCANAARTAMVAAEPLRSEPAEAWRRRFGAIRSNLVSWGGILFFVAEDRTRQLHAVRAATGESVGSPRLLSEGTELCVWQGTVVAWAPGVLRGFAHKPTGFGVGWERKIPGLGRPLLHAGVLLACGEGGLHAIDARTGRVLWKGNGPAATGRFALARDGPGGRGLLVGGRSGAREGYLGMWAFAESLSIADPARDCAGPPAVRWASVLDGGGRFDTVDLRRIPASGDGTRPGGWLLTADVPFRYQDGSLPRAVMPDCRQDGAWLSPIVTEPVAHDGLLFGFDAKGDLKMQSGNGRFGTLVERAGLPRGAQPGPAAGARDVLYFGNWAVDWKTGRVLWCRPEKKAVAECVPTGDSLLAYTLADPGGDAGEIVGLADPRRAIASAAAAGEPAPPTTPPPEDGLVLQDGRSLAGRVETAARGRVRLVPPDGEPREFRDEEVALVQQAGRVVTRRGENAVYRAWLESLRPGVQEALSGLFDRFARERLFAACRDVLAECRAWGMDAKHLEEMERRLTDRQDNPMAEARVKALGPEIAAARGKAREPFLAAARWCRERLLGTAASVLLLDAARILPGDAQVEAALKDLVPAAFPWASEKDATARWGRWAREILPADAAFVLPGQPLWQRAATRPWDEETLLLRTPHFSFLTRCKDPAVVGGCLRNGEWSVRVLETLVDRDEVKAVSGDAELMDVRLHESRAAYMKEKLPGGGHAMPWSAGFFSPFEGVSRFFVPEASDGDALGRGLFQVFSHELTHHFLECRWLGAGRGDRSDPAAPGFWCVEGVARFVEDQVVEMDRRGLRFDDPTVPSLDTAAQAAEAQWLFRPSALLDMDHVGFTGLETVKGRPVHLRNTIQTRLMTPIGLFYEQAGATVYFLVNDRGEEGRLAFFRYLSDYYSGRARSPGWKALGFESAEAFDAAFVGFLRKVR